MPHEELPPAAEGAPPDDLDATVQEVDAEIAAGRQEELNAAAPEATEPLEPAQVNALSTTVADAAGRMSDGQLQVQPTEQPGPVDQLPPDLFAQVMGFAAMVDAVPALSKYAFDPIALSVTNAGLFDMANTIQAMSEDEKALQAVKQPLEGGGEEAPEEPAPEEPTEPTDDELGALV